MKTSARAKELGRNKHEERFYDCPGAWLGNLPNIANGTGNRGNIVVDPSKALWAIRYLSKFYTLLGTSHYDAGCGGNDGLNIDFETKGRERVVPVTVSEDRMFAEA